MRLLTVILSVAFALIEQCHSFVPIASISRSRLGNSYQAASWSMMPDESNPEASCVLTMTFVGIDSTIKQTMSFLGLYRYHVLVLVSEISIYAAPHMMLCFFSIHHLLCYIHSLSGKS